ncbi:hypothetical protein J5T34_22225 [Cupriavidus gilardii]|uniref:hypothetical protein n=1 Tax=Cupriavidus gilardii TaxID=82541 RepID=UPI001ABE3F31|nr:hypothetical protein [Cupriavidus gilardii]MBO4123453.1 hypothetical protein [Cupriavidus gilardii]
MTNSLPDMDCRGPEDACAGARRIAPLHDADADPVTRFLQAKGLSTETAYLGESAFELGRRVRVGALDLIYRVEQGVMLICDMAAIDVPADDAGAMRALVSLIHAVERSVPEVSAVEGLVPLGAEDGSDEARLGRRLLEVYRKLGAQCDPEHVPGMVHVRYRMRGGAQQARRAPA